MQEGSPSNGEGAFEEPSSSVQVLILRAFRAPEKVVWKYCVCETWVIGECSCQSTYKDIETDLPVELVEDVQPGSVLEDFTESCLIINQYL